MGLRTGLGVLFFWHCFVLALYAAPLDFDNDGLSDIVGFENQRDGSSNELVFVVKSSATLLNTRTEWGSSKDLPAPGDYDGDGQTDLAIVRQNQSGILSWLYKASSNDFQISTIDFGLTDDYVLSGCDFDGDHISDLAVYRSNNLIIRKSSNSEELTISPSESDLERIYCADFNGDGKDDVYGQKLISNSSSSLKSKATYLAKIYGWDLEGNSLFNKAIGKNVSGILALDLNGDGQKDPAYFRELSRSRRRISVDLGNEIVSINLKTFSAIVSGLYSPGAIDGLVSKVALNDTFYKYSLPTQSLPESINIPNTATILPAINYALAGTATSKELCDEHLEAFDGLNGFLWKPVSDTTSNAVVVVPAPYRYSQAQIVKDGQILEKLSSGGIGNGNRQHWRSRKRASSFPSNITVIGIKKGKRTCWLVQDPLVRID